MILLLYGWARYKKKQVGAAAVTCWYFQRPPVLLLGRLKQVRMLLLPR